MADLQQTSGFTVECPHCHKAFDAPSVQGRGRIRGFKCPHCRLFVPFARAEEQDLLSPLTRDPESE
jgi:hypothetical protein